MTFRWDDDYDPGERCRYGVFILITVVAYLLGALTADWLRRPPSPEVVLQVDTIREPPQPDFIEMFRLQCYWAPREEEEDGPVR